MNAYFARFSHSTPKVLCVGALSSLLAACGGHVCVGFNAECSDGGGMPTVALSGTAATGRALASATVAIDCAQGSTAVVADGNGHYAASFPAILPCVITATSGGTTLHSPAFAGGTFNTTPETELMLVYLASQLGTSEGNLIANLASSGRFQQVLENQSAVLAAQAAVVTNLQQHYAIALTVPSFLTTSFAVGQPGVDSDLGALAKAGAIDTDGMPDPVAVSLLAQAGAANPL